MSKKQILVVMHGPSGAGKDSVIDQLRDRMGIHRPTSTTSRPPRSDEVDGQHYHFLTEAEFDEKIRRGDFVEYATVYDDYKGLERTELEAPLSEGRDVIIRTDVHGARTFRERLRGAIFIFLDAEDRDALRDRLVERGSEDEEARARRHRELEEEWADRDNNDYIVVNHRGSLTETVDTIEAIIENERANPKRPSPAIVDDSAIPPTAPAP